MSKHDQALNDVLHAARALLEAREDQMITCEEWEALERAVAAATLLPPASSETRKES